MNEYKLMKMDPQRVEELRREGWAVVPVKGRTIHLENGKLYIWLSREVKEVQVSDRVTEVLHG